MGKGPLVIKERIRLIDGELTIESNPAGDPGWKSVFRRSGKQRMDNRDRSPFAS